LETCRKTPNTLPLSASCKESPECMLSEEPVPQPPEHKGGLWERDATLTGMSGKAGNAR
jgi:hypothetical protein